MKLFKNKYSNQKESSLQLKHITSLSDNQLYPDFCLKASNDLLLFSNFRRNKIYQMILEHVSEDFGKKYLIEIQKNKFLIERMDSFKENDLYGNPEKVLYPEIGLISTTTLRYIKVLDDLLSLFKSLNKFSICEIGVGYGGQCRIINSICEPSNYLLVDIKPALLLTQRYLDNYILHSTVDYKTMNELKTQDFDLLISNYAFTELPRIIQEVYLKKLILNSKRGYITYNEINPDYFNSYKKEELLKIIPNSYIIDEVPLTDSKNCVIVWNNK